MRTTVRTAAFARTAALVCGPLSSLLYVAMNIFVPMQWEAYSVVSQTVSELSAIDAPTRSIWVPLGMIYVVLMTVFGWGVRASAGSRRALRLAGILLIMYSVVGLFWPPMHQREVLAAGGKTLTDTLHLTWAMVTVVLMMLAIGFAAAALGKRFRVYSVASIAMMFGFGMLTSREAPRIEANLPTPWVGVWDASTSLSSCCG